MTIQFPPADHSTALRPWLLRNYHHQHQHGEGLGNHGNVLALNSYSLTSLPLQFSTQFYQLSGHAGSLQPASPLTLWKKCTENELNNYKELSTTHLGQKWTAHYESSTVYKDGLFIELENLLSNHGNNSNVIDIKMGRRTWLEEECNSSELRGDLYEKMVKLDCAAPTQEENRLQKITKLRYMQWRETESSTAEYGFRIEGVKLGESSVNKDLKMVKTKPEIQSVLKSYLNSNWGVRGKLVEKLRELRADLEGSEWFRWREVIGSSLLIVIDSSKVDLRLIDFAKTYKSPHQLTHRAEWDRNREDGYLFGLDKLIEILKEI